jgi:DNA-binding transcriptional LysR family regulator
VAENLGLSAPAVSNALARLRRLLGDELFLDRKSTRLNSSHNSESRMPSSA